MKKMIVSALAKLLRVTVYIDEVRYGAKPAPQSETGPSLEDCLPAKH